MTGVQTCALPICPDITGIYQGFRCVGSQSKLGADFPVKAYKLSENRYTLEDIKASIPSCKSDSAACDSTKACCKEEAGCEKKACDKK